ncbi:MAG: type IV secretion system DNA-binding domain-containing protein [Patescibacteria group bacterium]|nr:type IV secretion system DNA-binding domain-containing protein [Patescibacteria group bacterium]MDD4611203.1 type IV secretion system DNA-binding domain-containing protein [Patescibacteria group bacterium]
MNYTIPQQDINFAGSLGGVSWDFWLSQILLFIAAVFLFLLIRKIVKIILSNTKYFKHVIFLVRLPKEKPKDEQQSTPMNRVQSLREEIAKFETVFGSIGGLRAQRGIISWFLGRNDHFSFEIVATSKRISFYAVAPKKMARYLEQQLTAYYPEAVVEQAEDYNIFNPHGEIFAGYLKTKRSLIFPIKTYMKMETDPMNSLINIMSKLESGEGMALQFVVRSAKGSWHNRALNIVREVNKGKSVADALKYNKIEKMLVYMGNIFNALSLKSSKDNPKSDNQNKLSPMEQEMLKVIEEKNSKSGLDVNLRVIASAKDKGRARLLFDNMYAALQKYNYPEYGNSFKGRWVFNNKTVVLNQWLIIRDFIFRRFKDRISFLLNNEELTSLFHLPLKEAETPNIYWLTARHAAAPANTPTEGIILGENIYRSVKKEIKIKRDDRRRHTYIIGKSGVGKSVLLASMAVQDIINGEGVCIVDPHGDLIKDVLGRIPAERAEDVILFAPADNERPLALNLLEFDPRYPEQKTFMINEMIKIFDKLYDLKSTGGPIFEQYMRNALLLIMADPESGSTLMEVPKVLADADFRKMKLSRCKDYTVVDFWKKEAEKAGGDAALANVVPYVTSKLTQFVSNDTMRPIIGQQKSSFNLRDVMDNRKILLVDLSKGAIGEMNAYLLGMILVGKILISALSRTDMPQEQRKDFYLYIDEFQNFTTDSINSILSEARKYALNLIIAHQYIGQLVKGQDTSIKDAVFGNVGTMITFKIGSEDAEKLEKEFAPVFNKYDLINIEKYTAYIKLLIDNTGSRPFSMKTLWPLPGINREDVAANIRTLSRLKYGQDRNIIEAEIARRAKVI